MQGPPEFAITGDLLSIAQEFAPDDVSILRRRAEAAWNAGDHRALTAITRRIVELDPADTVAQLRLLTAHLGEIQTAQARLEAYDRLLGPRGQALDASIRSRLALDAALLLREQGKETEFLERLKLAIRLDSTNKDAALLALTYYTQRADDPAGRVELLANLLYADPLDSKVHRSLRDEFAMGGAYSAAQKFHQSALAIEMLSGGTPSTEDAITGYAIEWMAAGPRRVMDHLTLQVETRRAEVATAGQRDPTKVDQPVVQRVQDVRLDVEFEQLRALTAFAQGDTDMLAESMNDMALTVASRCQALADVTRRPIGMTEGEAMQRTLDYIIELQILRMLVRTDMTKGREEFDKALEKLPATDPRRVDVEAWTLVAAGDGDGALAKIASATTPTLWTALAQATALEIKADKPQAAARFDAIARAYPLHALGVFAAWRAGELGGVEASRALARDHEAFAASFPTWLSSMITTPRLTQTLWVDLDATQASPVQHVHATVRLKNLSPIPLGLGSGRTLNSRLFFGPHLELGARTRSDNAAGEVFDIDQRLRLMPGEELVTSVWPEVGLVGWLQQVGAQHAARLHWRVFQGFETSPIGEKRVGPGCVEATTAVVARLPLQEARMSADKLAQRIASARDGEIPAVLVASLSRLMGGSPGAEADAESAQIVQALATAFPTWPEAARVAAVAVLPPVSIAPVLAPFDEAARKDADGRVMGIVLATRCTDPADPWLTSAAQSADPRLARLASMHAGRLRGGTRVYAREGTRAMPRSATEAPQVPAR
jgi:tetratricopeptide (TPR) repeat protein